MSFLLELDEHQLNEQLPPIFEKAELAIKNAEPLFKIDGQLLEVLSRNVPMHQAHFDLKAQEMKQLMRWLENYKGKLEAIHLKNYNKGQRALSATDQRILMGGERDIIEVNQLIIEATLFYSKFDAITEAFKQMGWSLSSIVKLRIAELHQVII